jgi:hypothetical protein
MALGDQRNFRLSGAITFNILEKSRAARAKDDYLNHQYRDFDL